AVVFLPAVLLPGRVPAVGERAAGGAVGVGEAEGIRFADEVGAPVAAVGEPVGVDQPRRRIVGVGQHVQQDGVFLGHRAGPTMSGWTARRASEGFAFALAGASAGWKVSPTRQRSSSFGAGE